MGSSSNSDEIYAYNGVKEKFDKFLLIVEKRAILC